MCAVIDFGICGHVVDVVFATYQQGVFAVVVPFHSDNGAGTVKIRVAVYVPPLALLDCHSFYSHGLEMFELLFFPFCETLLSFPAGLAVFRAMLNCSQREDKARVRSAASPGYPNFGGTRKFAEAHGRSPPISNEVALAVPPGRGNFARKNANPVGSE